MIDKWVSIRQNVCFGHLRWPVLFAYEMYDFRIYFSLFIFNKFNWNSVCCMYSLVRRKNLQAVVSILKQFAHAQFAHHWRNHKEVRISIPRHLKRIVSTVLLKRSIFLSFRNILELSLEIRNYFELERLIEFRFNLLA